METGELDYIGTVGLAAKDETSSFATGQMSQNSIYTAKQEKQLVMAAWQETKDRRKKLMWSLIKLGKRARHKYFNMALDR